MKKRNGHIHSYLALFPELCCYPVLVVDMKGKIEYLNPAANKLFPDLKLSQLGHPFLRNIKSAFTEIISNKNFSATWNIEIDGKCFEQTVYFVAEKHRLYIFAFDITNFKQIEKQCPRHQDKNKKWFAAEVNVDIRERKKIEQALQESQQRYQKIVSSLIDYIYTVYIQKGRIVDVQHSLACLAVTGYASEEFKLNPALWIDMVYKDDRKEVLQWAKRISKGEEVDAIEYRVICKNKKIKWIRNTPVFHYDSNKELVSYDGVVQDITDRKIAEQRKAELEAVKTIIDGMADSMVVIDESGKINQFNKSFAVNFGYDKGIISRNFSQLFREEDKPLFMKGIVECFRKGSLNNFEIGIYAKDKKIIPVLLNLRVLRDDNENIKNIIAVITDITGFKHIEDLKDEFINTVSHELRSPLSAIKEGVAIVLEEMAGKLNAKQKDFLRTAEHNVNRLSNLVNDILNYQKLNAGKVKFEMAEANINDLVKETSRELIVLAQVKGLELKLILEDSLPKINMDSGRIAEVLINLVNNAIKYTQEGGIIIRTFMKDDELCVSVEDTGVGIKKDDISKLFTSFSQINKPAGIKVPGVGLGLLISKKIVQEHKGRIWVESPAWKNLPAGRQGSKFIFTLPAAPHHLSRE